MRRRYLLGIASLLPLAWLGFRFVGGRASRTWSPGRNHERAVELDRLASGIHSVADARLYVDYVTAIFADKLPRTWRTKALRQRIARCEYAAVSDPQKGIAEQRLAAAWNLYAESIGVPDALRVTSAEVHDLRDAFLTTARLTEPRAHRNFWAVGSIYSTRADGSLAPACRPVEAIRILWDFANMPDNLLGARERVRKGVLSEEFRAALGRPASSGKGSSRFEVRSGPVDPVRLATRQYIAEHGESAWRGLVVTMVGSLLAGTG